MNRRIVMAIAATLAGAAIAWSACGPTESSVPPATALPEGVLLEADGLEILIAEVRDFDAYMESVDKKAGRKARIQGLLDRYLLPLKLAEAAFGELRAQKLAEAEGLVRAVGNGGYPGLKNAAKHALPEDTPSHWGRGDLHALSFAVARWAFDATKIGQVSPPLPTPVGWAVVSTYDIERGATRVFDRAEAIVVRFDTHAAGEFGPWLVRRREELADRRLRVHPDWRDKLPPGLQRHRGP